ncbi:hypothetical protein J6590_104223 [Homalodisca vitripennis]|nr:hypothetical protein J6590_078865 [Homalodisca vitripennis]KAG8299306.1 hypothetical protein J6590_104223 [Homalodisca vitripennis]
MPSGSLDCLDYLHQYGTRESDKFRIQKLKTSTFDSLATEVGVKLFNRLLEERKRLKDPKQLKARIRVLYLVDEVIMSRWDAIHNEHVQYSGSDVKSIKNG